jgi:hypothetical protein
VRAKPAVADAIPDRIKHDCCGIVIEGKGSMLRRNRKSFKESSDETVFRMSGKRIAAWTGIHNEHFSESLPIVGVKNAAGQMPDFVVESLKRCSITIAEHPGHSFPCTTINGFDEPKLVFFEPTK